MKAHWLGICVLASVGLFVGNASANMFDAVKSAVTRPSTPSTSTQAPHEQDRMQPPSESELAQGLIPKLSRELGISDEQAEGGTGALLQLAQASLSQGEFSQLGSAMPGMETLLAAAPALTGKGGNMGSGLSGVMSAVGASASNLSGVAKVTEQFEALGLSPAIISQFAQLIVSYFKGGEGNTAALLQKGLNSALNL